MAFALAFSSLNIARLNSRGVALAGFYGHGNFGDDLMAVLFGRHLQSLGVPFRIHRLCTPYAAPFALPVARTIEELLDGADTLVWGGGGLLVPWATNEYAQRFPGVAEEFAALVATARRRGLRLAALSVGGAANATGPLTPAYKSDFVAATETITVRNRGDLAPLAARGHPADWFPDIVWQTATHFPVNPVRGPGLRIGLDLYTDNLSKRHALYVLALLQAVIWRRPDCTFVFLNSRNASQPGEQRLGRFFHGRNVRQYRFHHPAEDIATLASLDLLISTRLHTPVVALQYRVPVVSLFGEGKTQSLFAELSLAAHSCSHRAVPGLIRLLGSRRRLEHFLAAYPFPDTVALARESRGHLDRLTQFVRPASAVTSRTEENLCPSPSALQKITASDEHRTLPSSQRLSAP